jgi:glycosyltransferase involved in cell wall biosynthesis
VGQAAYGYYPLMDCFVLPSLQEGLSIALLEAMASRLPCVVTSVDHTHPVIENRVNGMVIQPVNVGQLVDALEAIMGDNDTKIQLGNSAYDSVIKNFTLDGLANAYDTLISSLVNVRE